MKKVIPKILVAVGFAICIGCSGDTTQELSTQGKSEFTLRPTPPVSTDRVLIGTQTWMKKNLNVSRYRNGDVIPQIQNAAQFANINYGAWCYYQNNSANGPIYGKLYNLGAVMDPRGLAPQGWHVATDDDWTTLVLTLGGFSGADAAGGKLKATTLWDAPNTGATNSSGFTALPCGRFDANTASFVKIGQETTWWTSTLTSSGDGWNFKLFYNFSEVGGGSSYAQFGYSVRCVKD